MSSIDSAYNIGDHQQVTNWTFSFDNEESFEFRVRSVTLPYFKLTHESTRQGLKFYNGVEHVDQITLELYETLDFQTKKKLDALFGAVFDLEKKVFKSNVPENAFPTGILTMYGGEDNRVTRTFRMDRMRILGVDDLSLAYDSSGPLVYTVTFAIDQITEE